ncbi:MAG TPA: transposase, partial [Tepidisphaeraceae bacterium]|nr:transposase [Tepidisphaeraceae bacterium]
QKEFGQPTACKEGCGFPVPKLLGLFDAFSGLVLSMLCFPLYTHEQSKVWMLHPLLKAGDLLLGDRGFCSFVHLAMLFSRRVYGLFRMHQKQIVDFRPHRKHRRKYSKGKKSKGAKEKRLPRSQFVRRLGKHDQVVRWFKDAISRPKWMVYALVYNLVHAVMLRAAQRQGVAPQRISFIDPLRCLLGAEPGAELPDLLVNPHRTDTNPGW